MSTTASPTAIAFKEWAAIVHALLQGEQIVDVRKGGIREEGRHFDLRATRFWLYPTTEHQRAELLRPAYARWGAAPGEPAEDVVRIEGFAEVVGVKTITEERELEALESRVVWAPEYLASRFRWKRRDPLWVLALRVHRLAEPLAVPSRDEYRGCTSWVDVLDLPDPRDVASEPVLSDIAFAARRKGLDEALGGLREP